MNRFEPGVIYWHRHAGVGCDLTGYQLRKIGP
ncbi:hypothetical protein FGL95_28765 [Nocardiaceae bacterium YC2-7]|uniref:Uncharacterized protein n=1 Tax=Antrihabitans stalactiti TaxID=2584121 RepID=A0A848KR22_9NOCA|nr:hypothetical protein [Antrihabitans stalactiti]